HARLSSKKSIPVDRVEANWFRVTKAGFTSFPEELDKRDRVAKQVDSCVTHGVAVVCFLLKQTILVHVQLGRYEGVEQRACDWTCKGVEEGDV
ncbi:hypothetical protein HK100_004640, partial [Physocladia obscura]